MCHSTVIKLDTTPPTPPPTAPPMIATFSPESPVMNIVRDSRTFGITTNQTVNITWFINGSQVQSNISVMGANYTNTSAALGIWNVSAVASNINGTVKYTWTWNVTMMVPAPPVITSDYPYNSSVNNTVGESRKFGIAIDHDQIANIVWFINGSQVQSNMSVMGASYTNTSAAPGTWYVNAVATNTNGSVSYSWIWNVRYHFGQFLEPINNDGSSIFKLGSTIPIKFQLTDANGNYVTNAVARLNLTKITSTVTRKYLKPYTTGSGTTGDIFIYETNGNKYSYNLVTKSLSPGTWRLRVDINDGSSYAVNISLKK